MNKKYLLIFACLLLLLAGCSSASETNENSPEGSDDRVMIGNVITIDAPEELTLLENKETLAADGLYYATWVAGNSVPYKNSDGETIDLYDAQLYFLVSETSKEESAQKYCSTWLAAAKKNYDVQTEKSITCNDYSYTLITYDCISEDNPYDHGVSAFGVCGNTAVCAEFACLKNYEGDLESILTSFLDNCYHCAKE